MIIRTMILTLFVMFSAADTAAGKDAQRLDRIAKIYQSDAAKSIPEFRAYLAAHSDDDLAWTILGHAYKETDQRAEAETAYKEAIRRNPKRVEALTGMGILARIAGNYDEAMRWYEQAIKIDPKYAQAYSSIVAIALKKGDFKKAVSMGEKGFQLDKKDPVIAANLAIAYHYDKQPEARDRMTNLAVRLGYKKPDVLKKIYSGELDIRD
jgi:Tfp pilus assembly protein PilF